VANFSTWKRNCSCDGNSPTPADPQFVSSSNLTLTSSSPALNAGVDTSKAYDGTAPEIGAYEVPALPSGACRIGRGSNNKIVCNFSNIFPPLRASNFATGWTATRAGRENTIIHVDLTGQN